MNIDIKHSIKALIKEIGDEIAYRDWIFNDREDRWKKSNDAKIYQKRTKKLNSIQDKLIAAEDLLTKFIND